MKLRSSLGGIPAYVPGRPPARREGLETYKVSSNENPYAPMPSILAAAESALRDMNRYPDMSVTALHHALAERFSVSPAQIASGTGSVGLLQQFVQATSDQDDEVIFAWRSFEAYPILASVNGARSVRVPLLEDESHDLLAMASAVSDRTRLLLVCQPNNPTGVGASAKQLHDLLQRVPEHVTVVIDEAYVEFVDDPAFADGLDLFRQHRNVALLRTFSKAYGLAGLRVGYAIAHEELATALRQCAVPFGVSGVAQAAALAALEIESELMPRVRRIIEARRFVTSELRAQGWTVPDSQANFVWLRTGSETQAFAAYCDENGLAIRPYGDEGARVTVGDESADTSFIQLAGEWRATHA